MHVLASDFKTLISKKASFSLVEILGCKGQGILQVPISISNISSNKIIQFVDLKLVMKCKKVYNHRNLDFIYTKPTKTEIITTVNFPVIMLT